MGSTGETCRSRVAARSAYVLVLLVLAAIILAEQAAAADAPSLQIEVLPATISEVLPAATVQAGGGYHQAVVVVRNSGTTELRTLKLTSLSSSYVISACIQSSNNACGSEATLQVLPAGGTYSWPVVVSSSVASPTAAAIYFTVAYSEGTNDVRIFQIATLNVAVPTPLKDSTEVQLVTSMDSISEYRPGKVYVVVKNNSDHILWVKHINVHTPGFIQERSNSVPASAPVLLPASSPTSVPASSPTAAPTSPSTPVQTAVHIYNVPIAPGSGAEFPYDVSIPEMVRKLQPGKQTILFSVDIARDLGGQETRLFASKDVSASAFGESEILGLLGVSVFLLLPGVIIMLFMPTSVIPVATVKRDLKDPTFLYCSVPLSLLMALVVYPLVTKLLSYVPGLNDLIPLPREYLTGYALIDFLLVFLVALFFDLIIWAGRKLLERLHLAS